MTGAPPEPWPAQPGWPARPHADQEGIPPAQGPGSWAAAARPRRPRPSLPVVATRYHGFWRTPRWALWKPLLGLAIGVGGYFALSLIMSIAALIIDAATGRVGIAEHAEQLEQGGGLTPSLFTLNNLSLAACILLAWAVGALHGQRPGWMSSVLGRFRWRWFFGCIGWLAPLWVIMSVVSSFLPGSAGDATTLRVTKDTGVMIAAVLLTTPLQCVGEEFGFRGLLNRAVASFVPQSSKLTSIISALLGGAVSSFAFMLAHSAQDPWLNVYYFCFGATACYLCYESGGLEASSAMHVVNNLSSMLFLPFTDFSRMFDRSAGTASPWILVQLVVVAAGALIITWRARRRGIVSSAAPAGQPFAVTEPAASRTTEPAASWTTEPAAARRQLADGAPGTGPEPKAAVPSAPTGRYAVPPTAQDAVPPTAQAGVVPDGQRPIWQPSAPPMGTPWDEHGRPVNEGTGQDPLREQR